MRSRHRYAALRQRGHSHGRALRTVADRVLSVACIPARTADPVRPHLHGSRGRRTVSIHFPSLCSIENDHPLVDLPPGKAPGAAAVKDAAANAAASAEPAQRVLDLRSMSPTILPILRNMSRWPALI
jgi:hypothetical protein